VIDLGVNVAPEKFIEQIEEHKPDIVGFSAFLTTTMPMFKANINALQKAGMRDQVIVMVGGAPVTQEYADAVGADGYAADASAAVVRAKELIQRRARHGHIAPEWTRCSGRSGEVVIGPIARSASSASGSTRLAASSSRNSCARGPVPDRDRRGAAGGRRRRWLDVNMGAPLATRPS
jgi:cobalamin-dependent methionine synthase I